MLVDESIEIEADDVHAAARDILDFLEDTCKDKEIYFKGWDGFGASAALKVVAKMLRSAKSMKKNPKLKFDIVIHIDCSLWKSRRAVQKAIAEELKLPSSVMAIFDQVDRDDDFKGIDEATRREIEDVTKHIFMNLAGQRFVVIFHNGGNEYIDFFEFGIPIYGHLRSKVLWTFHGRFRPHVQVDKQVKETIEKRTDVFLRAVPTDRHSRSSDHHHQSDAAALTLAVAMLEEAREVAAYLATCTDRPTMVLECILYMWAHRHITGIDWGARASSYWVCDGIIRTTTEKNPDDLAMKNPDGLIMKREMWDIADDLRSNIHMDWDLDYVSLAVPNFKWLKPSERWILIFLDALLIPQQHSTADSQQLSSQPCQKATSFVLTSNNGDKPSTESDEQASTIDTRRLLPSHMLKHCEARLLHVIQLSWCTFSFSSPPFLHCKNLKFLRLEHCKDVSTCTSDVRQVKKDQTTYVTGSSSSHSCPHLWVLDLNHTNMDLWYTRAPMNPIELHFNGVKNWIEHHLHAVHLGELDKLGVTADPVEILPNLLQAKTLRTIILNGCPEVKEVVPDVLPPSLESFSFFAESSSTGSKTTPTKGESQGEGKGGAKVHTISLRCCSQLRGLFLKGLFKNLKMLDLSCTLLQKLDLAMVQAPCLRGLRLLACHMLCTILWPPEMPQLHELQIDTTQSSTSLQQDSHEASCKFNIFVRDARLLDSLVPIRDQFLDRRTFHVDISSPECAAATYASSINDDSIIIATSGCSISKNQTSVGRWWPGELYVKDVSSTHRGLHHADSCSATAWMWDCPQAPDRDAYIKVEDRMQKELLRPGQETDLLCDHARILHVHDCMSIRGIPFPAISSWAKLLWCRVERCHGLDAVFCSPEEEGVGGGGRSSMFWLLQTLWVSQLQAARSMWSWSGMAQPGERSFEDLGYVHVDHCPRLLHVLPLSMSVTLNMLHTVEIVCCGSLTEVFPVPVEREEQQAVHFWRLRRLHLHELPALRCLSGRTMFAPNLETVKVRGCWSLRRLPSLIGGSGDGRKPPTVDCEKEWWDQLEWDGVQLGHHASLYRTRHPRYVRDARLLKGTLLT